MSSFQKNALLSLIVLATIAYPPLYFSIKQSIAKESLPKSYNSPKMIPHVMLGTWDVGKFRETGKHSETIRNLVSLEFTKMSNVVYYGKEENVGSGRETDVHIKLSGKFEIKEDQIFFKPEIYYPREKRTFTGEKQIIHWADVGNFPIEITNSYHKIISESIRLERFLLNPPIINLIPYDLNPEILSSSEYELYANLSLAGLSMEEKNNQWLSLVEKSPKATFLHFEKSLYSLSTIGQAGIKDIWKEWEKNKFISSSYTYLLAFQLGSAAFPSSPEQSLTFYQLARSEREKQSRVFHPEYAESLTKIGVILYESGKKEESLYYFTSAKEMYEALGLSKDQAYFENQLYFSLLLANLGQREVALNQFFLLEPLIFKFNEIEKAVFYYNFARLEYSLEAFDAAISYAKKSRSILFSKNLSNHELNFSNLILEGAAKFRLGKFNQAQTTFEDIDKSKTMLPIEDKDFYRANLFNLALIHLNKSAITVSENIYKQYTRLTSYSLIVPLELKSNPEISGFFLPRKFSRGDFSEFTDLEATVIRSSTGRYIFSGQEQEIRARTYQDRLEDTNEFLTDLIRRETFGSEALTYLKGYIFNSKLQYEKGENIVFIDIGPALGNIEAPGITSLSVSYNFPKMEVILWELPSEVDLFLKNVPPDKKESVYSFKNIRILAADGVGKFEKEYFDHNHWLLKNRSIPSLKNKTIIFRAANSIDIYESYAKIEPHFKDIGKSLKDNPVLYFFNRSILLKPSGQTKFSFIGYQSVRGFHHNFQSLDRNGEPPYTLIKYTLSNN